MSALTRVEAGPMLYAPRPRPQLVSPKALPAPQPVDLDEESDPPDEHDDFSVRALANLAHELQHSTAEVNVLARADALPTPAPLLAEAVSRQAELISDLDASLFSSHAEGERLREAALRIKGIYEEQKAHLEDAYQRAIAPVMEELGQHTRHQAQLRRDLDRRFVRLQPKRASSKRA